jgi:WD40 repeat protein
MGSLLLLPLLALAADEKKDTAPTPIAPAAFDRKEPIDYAKDIQPILSNKCTVCHSGNQLEGKYDMGSHAGVLKGGKRGTAVVAFKPAESNIYLFASHTKKPTMPPRSENNDLTSQDVAILKAWIEQGAKGPVGPEVKTRAKIVVGLPPALVKPVRAVAVSPDKTVIAAGRGNQVHLFDAKDGKFIKTLVDPQLKTPDGKPASAAHLSLVESMAYSPDGKTLATGSFQEVTLWDPEKGTVKQRIGGFAHNVTCIAYSADGKYFATGGGAPTEDGEVKIFDSTGKPVVELKGAHSDTVFGVSFSPDGKLLATAAADKFVKVFEIPSGKFVKSFEGHTHHVLDVGWTPDGKKLASAGADNFVKVWDYEKGEKIRDIQGYQKQVTRLVFVGKTPTFLTASGDGSVKLTNAENGGQQRAFGGATDFVYAVAASPDGNVVAAGGEEGVVRLYNGQNGQLVKALLPPDAEPKKDEKKDEPKKDEKKK